MARTMAITRFSHAAWNRTCSGSGCTGPKPIMPPMSAAPFMAHILFLGRSWRGLQLGRCAGQPGADHAVAGDQLRQPLRAPALGAGGAFGQHEVADRSEEHTSELQSLMRISYAVFCLKKKKKTNKHE